MHRNPKRSRSVERPIRRSAMGTPAKLPLPTLAGHVWHDGRYKIGGAKVNERCIPAHFVLAIVVAEACDWCERKIQSSTFTLRDGVEAALGFVRLKHCMSANKEVRRAKFFFCHQHFSRFILFGAAHTQLLAKIGMYDTPESIGKQLQRGSTVWLEMGLWNHWVGQKSVYQMSSLQAVGWVIEQAAHLRRQCYTDTTSRAFALSLTMEKHG